MRSGQAAADNNSAIALKRSGASQPSRLLPWLDRIKSANARMASGDGGAFVPPLSASALAICANHIAKHRDDGAAH